MNSHSENLHSLTFEILENEETMLRAAESQMTASLFTFYYARGAVTSAKEKLESTEYDLLRKESIKDQAVNCNDISKNILASATQADQFVKQLVTNSAVCASDVQVATNSAIKLASELGSINSIINAADFDTEISKQAENVYHLIQDTAFMAEEISQLAMEISVLTAETCASITLDKAKSVNDLTSKIFEVYQTDVDAVLQQSINDDHTLDLTIANAKLAEANFEETLTIKNRISSAYKLINSELNLGLTVVSEEKEGEINLNVEFTLIKSPFAANKKEPDPVSDYYLFIVKKNKKAIFSISDAENVRNDHEKCIRVTDLDPKKNKAKCLIHCVKEQVLDADGDEILRGTEYVVFVMAVFTEKYKKERNVFDDFLSAPSEKFCLTHQLKAVDKKNVSMTSDGKLEFEIAENSLYQVEYRCIFLQKNEELIKELGGLNQSEKYHLGFIFNLMLAQQVSVANYSVAKRSVLAPLKTSDKKSVNTESKDKPINTKWEALIHEETTDNFGNQLVEGKSYIPVILSFSIEKEEKLNLFTNSLSDYVNTKAFIYSKKNSTAK